MQGRRKHQLASRHGSGVDVSSVSLQTILRQARKSGQLNLSNRSFTEGWNWLSLFWELDFSLPRPFAAGSESSSCGTFAPWNFRTLELSLLRTFSLQLSLHGTFALTRLRIREGAKVRCRERKFLRFSYVFPKSCVVKELSWWFG